MYTDIEELDLMNQPDEGDPLIWLRKHRDELAEKHPTIEALSEYYRQVGTLEDALARVQKNRRKERN